MKLRSTQSFSLATLSGLMLSFTAAEVQPAIAENLNHTQQLISTKVCVECDLSTAGLAYADLVGVNLSRANLVQANLSQANLKRATLSGANLAGATLVNANLSGADLSNADLRGADLRGAILTGANLTGAILERTNLFGAIDVPAELMTIETLYLWGMEAAQRGNDKDAIQHYSRAIELQPDLANAYLARGIARFRTGDRPGALQDATQAEQLYTSQGNPQGKQAALQLSQGITTLQENAERANRGGGGGNFLGFLGSLTTLLLRFVLP